MMIADVDLKNGKSAIEENQIRYAAANNTRGAHGIQAVDIDSSILKNSRDCVHCVQRVSRSRSSVTNTQTGQPVQPRQDKPYQNRPLIDTAKLAIN